MGGRGIPDIVKQVEITTQVELAAARGTLKVAQLVGDEEMPNLVVTSLYDQKPFYMMSTGMPQISWVKVTKKIWSTVAGKYKEVPFYRLNIVNEYNLKMGRTDLGDQLRGSYRYDHWLRNRKWWWSIFFWTFGMLHTNSYILFCLFWEAHGYDPPFSHYEYRRQCFLAWLQPEVYFSQSSNSVATSTTASSSCSSKPVKRSLRFAVTETRTKSVKFTDATLCHLTGSLKTRLDFHKPHWPLPACTTVGGKKTYPRCQLHSYLTGGATRTRKQVLKCEHCNVFLCADCFRPFHTVLHLKGLADLPCYKVSFKCFLIRLSTHHISHTVLKLYPG